MLKFLNNFPLAHNIQENIELSGPGAENFGVNRAWWVRVRGVALSAGEGSAKVHCNFEFFDPIQGHSSSLISGPIERVRLPISDQ